MKLGPAARHQQFLHLLGTLVECANIEALESSFQEIVEAVLKMDAQLMASRVTTQ